MQNPAWRSDGAVKIIALAGTIFMASAPVAGAQPRGIVSGRITNSEKTPVRAAQIQLIGTTLAATTDSQGVYRIAAVPAGHYIAEVKLLGYSPATQPFDIEDGGIIEVSFALATAAVALDTVKVTGDAYISPSLRGFEERRARGNGRFFTREDIARIKPRILTDIFRRIPGMQIQSAGGSMNNNESVRSGRIEGLMGARTCNVLFYVNGAPFPLQQDFTINHFVSPEDVVGIEVYPGASEIPPQFETGAFNSRCGVVVIWTREGGEKRRKR
jgi:hypothetical protein